MQFQNLVEGIFWSLVHWYEIKLVDTRNTNSAKVIAKVSLAVAAVQLKENMPTVHNRWSILKICETFVFKISSLSRSQKHPAWLSPILS